MSITTPPCSWPVSYAGSPSLPDDWDSDGAPFEAMASEYLWRWTGRSLGTCPVILRPCRQTCCGGERPSTFDGRGPRPSGRTPWTPALIDGKWFNLNAGIEWWWDWAPPPMVVFGLGSAAFFVAVCLAVADPGGKSSWDASTGRRFLTE